MAKKPAGTIREKVKKNRKGKKSGVRARRKGAQLKPTTKKPKKKRQMIGAGVQTLSLAKPPFSGMGRNHDALAQKASEAETSPKSDISSVIRPEHIDFDCTGELDSISGLMVDADSPSTPDAVLDVMNDDELAVAMGLGGNADEAVENANRGRTILAMDEEMEPVHQHRPQVVPGDAFGPQTPENQGAYRFEEPPSNPDD